MKIPGLQSTFLVILLVLMLVQSAFAQEDLTGTVNRNANLRAGPGTTFAIAGSAPAGAKVTIIEKNAVGDWYKLDSGKWIAAFLVTLSTPAAGTPSAPTGVPAANTPTPAARTVPIIVPTVTPAPVQPAPAAVAPKVQLLIITNNNSVEILELRNGGSAALDIGGWRIDGSKGDDYCKIPAGIVLQPGSGYQIATGDSQPQIAGSKCGDKPIWNNGGESIYVWSLDGLVLTIESERR